jgi:hypothetical protein
MELNACIGRAEPPPHLDGAFVAVRLPGRHFPPQLLGRADPAAQALPAQHAQLDLRHVEPTAVLGRMVDLQPFGDPPRPRRLERLVQRRQLVRVQVVHHHHLDGVRPDAAPDTVADDILFAVETPFLDQPQPQLAQARGDSRPPRPKDTEPVQA